MLIVDSQVHIWENRSPKHPWKPGRHIEGPLRSGDLLKKMDEAGVTRAVLVPPSWDGGRPNECALAAAQQHPDRFAVMGRLDIESPASRGALGRVRDQRGMLGLRLSFSSPGWAKRIEAGELDWFWQEAEQVQLPLMIMANHGMVHLIGAAAQRHPGLRIALCHLALPGKQMDDAAFIELDKLLAVARFPNINVKISSLPGYSSEPYPYRNLHPYLRRVYDAFGPRRIFWGTDFSRLPCSYRQAITMITEEISWLSASDQEWIMGRALCDWLGWA
jgi:predicted TIM-barrel fold metal-dependent hydrolase